MKLLKKLLPIATVASIATVVTPLTVSCGTNKGISDFSYSPDIAMHEAKMFTSQQEAEKEYYDCVKENPKIFVEDLYWAQSQLLSVIDGYLYRFIDDGDVKFNFNVENVDVSNTTKEGKTIYLMSFDLDYSWSLAGEYDDYSEGYKVTRTADASCKRHMEFTNVPFTLAFTQLVADTPYFWVLSPAHSTIESMVNDSPDLEIKADVAVTSKITQTSKFGTIVESPYIDYKFNSTFNKDYQDYPEDDLPLVTALLRNVSYHFLNCGFDI